MNRKYFLSTFFAGTTLLPQWKSWAKLPESHISYKIPAYLNPGDLIGITSPAGFISTDQIQPAIQQMQNWGFKVKVGDTIGKRDFTFGGADQERLADLQQMMNAPDIKAIMCARGGYGLVRIIDQIDFSSFKHHPKWIIGFSDITVMHCHLSRNLKIASIHAKMCNSFPDDWSAADPIQIDTILSIKKALSGDQMTYHAPVNANNRMGRTEGILVGGNLSIMETLTGSMSDLDTRDKILFIEDTGEYLYSIDRMLWNLKRSGKLKQLKGLIIGGFKVKPDDPGEEFGKSVFDIVMEKVREYQYPVAFDFPVGHQKANYALQCGLTHYLNVSSSGTTLTSRS